MGSDTTFIHSLADSIAVFGHARWIIHPLSFLGLYAFSYPSGIPFVFAAITTTSGIPVEGTMLLLGWILSMASAPGTFLAARRIRRDDIFALSVAALFSLAPFYLKDTTWVGSSRGFAVAILPAFLLLLLCNLRSLRASYLALAVLLVVILGTIHRMGFLAIFLLIGYFFAIPFHRITQRLRFALVRYERPSRYGIVLSSLVGFGLVVYVQYLYPGLWGASLAEQYGGSSYFQGEAFHILLANMAISLTARVGVLFPLTLFGLVAYLWHRPKEATDKFLITAIIVFLPLLSLRDYIAEFMILFFVVLLVFGLVFTGRLFRRRDKIGTVIVVVAVVGSVLASWELKDYWREKYPADMEIPDATYASALYLRYQSDGTIIANEGLLGGRLGALSGRPVLPFGGASYHRTGPQQIIWGYVRPDSVAVQPIAIQAISFSTDELFLPVNVRNVEVDWEAMLFYRDPAQAAQELQRYGVHYVVVDQSLPNQFFSYGSARPSVLLATVLPTTSYVVYSNGAHAIWYVG
jgi:hypothetical protein